MRWIKAPRPCWRRSTWTIRANCSGPACTPMCNCMCREVQPMAPNPNALRALAGAALAIVIAATAQAQTPAVSPQPAAITGEVQPIDLPTALRLAGANNIDLALVREALVQAQAQNDAATLSFVPALNGGLGYA